MSRNGTGTYVLPTGNPVVPNTAITVSWANGTLNDIANALTQSLAADGQTPVTGNLNMNSNNINNVATLNATTENVSTSNVTNLNVSGTATFGGTVAGGTFTLPTVISMLEPTTVAASAATGTVNFDVITQAVVYFTANATGNWTLNIRGNSGTSLNSTMLVGQTIAVSFLVTQGSTAYYNSAVQIDGAAVTPKWQGIAPSFGNPNSIDVYTYAVIKTGSATFTVLASQTKFV
jgi:hypothetical protein